MNNVIHFEVENVKRVWENNFGTLGTYVSESSEYFEKVSGACLRGTVMVLDYTTELKLSMKFEGEQVKFILASDFFDGNIELYNGILNLVEKKLLAGGIERENLQTNYINIC